MAAPARRDFIVWQRHGFLPTTFFERNALRLTSYNESRNTAANADADYNDKTK
jgi:hypothetical protein